MTIEDLTKRVEALEAATSAAMAPPKLPAQFEAYKGDGNPDQRMFRMVDEHSYWDVIVVPAQPRPADFTDHNDVTWRAGEWTYIDRPQPIYFHGATTPVVHIGGGLRTPLDTSGPYAGWRWTATIPA